MVDAALNVAAEQIVEHSAYGAAARAGRQPWTDRRPAEPLPLRRHRRRGRARRLGRDRGGDRRRSGSRSGMRSGARRGRWTRADDRGRAAGAARRHRPPPVELVRRAERRRDRRLPVGGRRPGRQGDAAARAGDAPAAASPRVLRGGRPARHRNRPAQHPADPVLPRPRSVPPSARPAARRAQRRGAASASACPTTRSAELEAAGVIGRAPDSRPAVGSPRVPPARLRPRRGVARALDRTGLDRQRGRHGRGRVGDAGRADLPPPSHRHPATARADLRSLPGARDAALGRAADARRRRPPPVDHPGDRHQLRRPSRGGGPVPPRLPPHRRPRHARSRSPPRADACSTAPSRS